MNQSLLPLPDESKVAYIKRIRDLTGQGLYEAKMLADAIFSEDGYGERQRKQNMLAEVSPLTIQTRFVQNELWNIMSTLPAPIGVSEELRDAHNVLADAISALEAVMRKLYI